MMLPIVPTRIVSAKENPMKTGKTKWLGLLLAGGATICWFPTPANAQDDARELYRKMYEGGLITQAEYEHTTGVSAPAVKSTASIDTTAAEGISGETGNAKPDATEQIRHRSLSAEGVPVTVEQFRQAKRAKLAARVPALYEQQRIEKLEAERIAQSQNMPIRFAQKDGSICELMAIQGGHPVLYTTYNIRAADTIGTDEVWPGGSLGLSLSGTNRTLGVWDSAAVRTTHVEFVSGGASRLASGDGYTNFVIDPHSTEVAGTLIASGVNTTRKACHSTAPCLHVSGHLTLRKWLLPPHRTICAFQTIHMGATRVGIWLILPALGIGFGGATPM